MLKKKKYSSKYEHWNLILTFIFSSSFLRQCKSNLEEQRAWATIGRTYLCQVESRNLRESAMANKQAEKAFFMALNKCETLKSSITPVEYMSMKVRLFLNLGWVYDNRGDVKQSSDAMKKAVVIAEYVVNFYIVIHCNHLNLLN